MADGAAESRRSVRTEARMITKRLGRIVHGWIVDTQMTRRAAVHALQPRKQYLVDLRRGGEYGGFGHRVWLPCASSCRNCF